MYRMFLIVFFLFHINTSYSEVYKWTDENGKIAYGNKPNSDDAVIIDIKKQPLRDKHYQEIDKKRQKLLDVMQEERKEKLARKNKEKEEKEKQEQECIRLKKEFLKLKNARLIYEETGDLDNPRFLSVEERQAKEEKYEEYIEERC